MIGQQLDGKYEITGQLGSGAMGTVYEARNIQTGRMVAVKVIQSGLGTDPALVARFQREARAAGAIESTHIAQVLDAGQDRVSESPYLVMELLKGEDLDTLFRHLGPFRHTLALRIIAQALSGLERAHASGVIHRDIKPANLFIARADASHRVVKLVDFGIAKVKDELAASNHALTQTSALLGSPLYMSPEQAKASKKVDGRADLWSLGVVLYQLLTGKAPHAHAESLTELLLAICTEDAKPVQAAAPWVPAEVALIVERAVRLDPSKRFATAAEMRDAIAAVIPDWNTLSESMLTPMTAEERSFVAEPATQTESLGVTTGPQGSGPHAALAQSPQYGGATVLGPLPAPLVAQPFPSQASAPALAASGPTTDTQAGTSGTLETTPSKKSRVLPGAVLGVGLVLAGIASARFLHFPSSDATMTSSTSSAGLVAMPAPLIPPPSAPVIDPAKPDAATSAISSAASTAPQPPTTTTMPTATTRIVPQPSQTTRPRPGAPTTTAATPSVPTTTPPKPPAPATPPSSNISREFQ